MNPITSFIILTMLAIFFIALIWRSEIFRIFTFRVFSAQRGTTLGVDTPRDKILGELNDIPMVATDIIYEGAAVGIVKASGNARPLTSVDKFAGFAQTQCDNSTGAAAAKNVKVISKGKVQLAITGAVITDVGLPVYATDDDTFVFTPVGAVYIGKVIRFVSAGIVEVQFDAVEDVDPWAEFVAEALSGATKTLDLEDSGKVICCTVTTVITLPATAVELFVALLCLGPYGTVQISASPGATDLIICPNLSLLDNKDLINTLATANRGDYVILKGGAVNGYIVHKIKGTWVSE
jgi:hypothetical protein